MFTYHDVFFYVVVTVLLVYLEYMSPEDKMIIKCNYKDILK